MTDKTITTKSGLVVEMFTLPDGSREVDVRKRYRPGLDLTTQEAKELFGALKALGEEGLLR